MARVRKALWSWAAAVFAVAWVASSALASTTRGSFDRPPYVHGSIKGRVPPAGFVPLRFRAEVGSLDPDTARSAALAALMDSLRSEMEHFGLTPVSVRDDARGPDVAFGCRRGGTNADGTPRSPSEIDPTEPRRMAFDVEGPSKPWREQVRAGGSPGLVVSVQLGFAEYWVRKKDWKGNKVIDLGSGRSMEIPWLTSLDDPVQVLQLTGALVAPDGKLLRVAAEALIARRTGMAASSVGTQEVLTEDDLRSLQAAGDTPAWRAALQTLVAELMGEK